MQTSSHWTAAIPFKPVATTEYKGTALTTCWNRLKEFTACSVRVGAEIEFYLEKSLSRHHEELLAKCASTLKRDGVEVSSIKRESGNCQYEVVLSPSNDPVFVAASIDYVKTALSALSQLHGCPISFAARPDWAEPPNALHISVSLIDEHGVNRFAKRRGNEAETEVMQHSIAGLCELMNPSMIFFAPKAESYGRFKNGFAEGPYKFSNAPSNVSWGGNNRTVAIRIPTSTEDPASRHLEHRVPGSDANPSLAIASILAGISYGVERCIPLTLAKAWGDGAYMADGVALARSLQEATMAYLTCVELRERINLGE